MIHLQCYILNLYIFVSLSFCLLELSSLKSLTLWVFSFSFFFLVKVEMSHSRARLSNPALYAFQPHTPYLLLTASNWNRDHIFHTAPQQRSLLEPTFHKGREFFCSLLLLLPSPPDISLFVWLARCLRGSSIADLDIVLFSTSPLLSWRTGQSIC